MGIFAERLELEGLAEVLGAPLHLYYHLSCGDAAAAAGAAAEVIHPPLGEAAAAGVLAPPGRRAPLRFAAAGRVRVKHVRPCVGLRGI